MKRKVAINEGEMAFVNKEKRREVLSQLTQDELIDRYMHQTTVYFVFGMLVGVLAGILFVLVAMA
jgi:hypothetical protein